MPTYISFIKYTAQAIKNAKDIPERLDSVRKLYKSMGSELKAYYLTMGRYDAVVISETPDDATAARLVLTIAGRGNISSETVRAFNEAEVKQIVGGIP